VVSGGPAARRWAEQLALWAIPDEILAQAPESPWGFPPELFAAPVQPADTPSRRRALEALPDGGSVLDVGAGAGAAGLALVPPAGRLTAVDQSPTMLETLVAGARARGVKATAVTGTWPEVADRVGVADVVVCHHVLYNVADAVPFVAALTDHARRRVVLEITTVHPQAGLNYLWRHFHGLDRPEGPGVEDAIALLREAGLEPGVERFERPPRSGHLDRQTHVAFVRRRLCLDRRADPEVDRLLPPGAGLPATGATCLWWDAPS
jgi:SAM-dependent methyltransferase